MGTMSKQSWMKKAAMLSILPITAFGVAGCNSTSGPETGTDVEDIVEEDELIDEEDVAEEADPALEPYDGAYDQDFYDDAENYVGQEVTVSADVTATLTDDSFVIAGGPDTTVDPLLVIEEQEIPPLDVGQAVKLTGTVEQAFDVAAVEEEFGIDLEDELFADYVGDPYLAVTSAEILEEQ
ncbi:hypothetical protein GCM10009784_25420 [Arthrobacter parietis]|uniref:DUF5666 domain-containing protein n=2 Tax=Arthrobacter parietis TaxID=271434 RepID=A0ABN3AZ00_9MICC